MKTLVGFMNSPVGRLARIGLGVGLIVVGFTVMEGAAGMALAVVGLVPIALGVSGRCMVEFIAPK